MTGSAAWLRACAGAGGPSLLTCSSIESRPRPTEHRARKRAAEWTAPLLDRGTRSASNIPALTGASWAMVPGFHARGVVVLYTNKKLSLAVLGVLAALVVTVGPVAAIGTASATASKPAASMSAGALSSGTYDVVTLWGSDKWTGQWILKVSGGHVTGLAWFIGPGGPYLAPYAITGTTGAGGINLNRSQCAVDGVQTGCFHQAYAGRSQQTTRRATGHRSPRNRTSRARPSR